MDIGYLDWRFLQDTSSCADGVVKGKWLAEGSGFRVLEPSGARNASPAAGGKTVLMVYGTGSMTVPLKAAYDAAGLQMPQ